MITKNAHSENHSEKQAKSNEITENSQAAQRENKGLGEARDYEPSIIQISRTSIDNTTEKRFDFYKLL
jgi:hypothetical protein